MVGVGSAPSDAEMRGGQQYSESENRHVERLLVRRFRSSLTQTNDLAQHCLFAFGVGIVAALGAICFRWLIDFVHTVMYRDMPWSMPLPLLVGIGGLIVGLVVYFGARDAHGHGVPEVITSVMMRGGKISGRVALVKMVASAITIGSGGSAGREGPIVQIGAALGSQFAQMFKLPEKGMIMLVACGAAAGIASTFNAPLAGVFFALEIILGSFAVRTFGMVALSSVTSSVITRFFLGNYPAFQAPTYVPVHNTEYGWYLLLGLLAGVVGIMFTRSLYLVEDFFDLLHIPQWVKPAIGGVLVGIIAIWYPQVCGNGYESIIGALTGSMNLRLMVLLIFIKTIATSLTLGSGGSGGDLAPSLFIGAVLGGAFGCMVHAFVPGATAESGAYALVGMAAVFGATSRAPITAVIMLFELTSDYSLILPLMAATVVSVMVSGILDRESIYTVKLSRKGMDVWQRGQSSGDPMRSIPVSQVMTTEYSTVTADITIAQLAERFSATGYKVFPVVDNHGLLLGMLTSKDLEYAQMRNTDVNGDSPISILLSEPCAFVCPDDSLALALRTMGRFTVGRLPVVDSADHRKLLGLIRRAEIVSAYNDATKPEGKKDWQVHTTAEADFMELKLSPDSAWNEVSLKDIPIPDTAVVVAIRRGQHTIIPRGHTNLCKGDVVVAYAQRDSRGKLRAMLSEVKASQGQTTAP